MQKTVTTTEPIMVSVSGYGCDEPYEERKTSTAFIVPLNDATSAPMQPDSLLLRPAERAAAPAAAAADGDHGMTTSPI